MFKNVEEVVRKIIGENCDDPEKIKDLGLKENLQNFGINSFTFIKIVVGFEREFGLEFEDENLSYKNFQTLQSIIEYIEENYKGIN